MRLRCYPALRLRLLRAWKCADRSGACSAISPQAGRTALHAAVSALREDRAALLLQQEGLDVNLRDKVRAAPLAHSAPRGGSAAVAGGRLFGGLSVGAVPSGG